MPLRSNNFKDGNQKLFKSKVKGKNRKEGKDRKKDVVGLPGFISRLVIFSFVMS